MVRVAIVSPRPRWMHWASHDSSACVCVCVYVCVCIDVFVRRRFCRCGDRFVAHAAHFVMCFFWEIKAFFRAACSRPTTDIGSSTAFTKVATASVTCLCARYKDSCVLCCGPLGAPPRPVVLSTAPPACPLGPCVARLSCAVVKTALHSVRESVVGFLGVHSAASWSALRGFREHGMLMLPPGAHEPFSHRYSRRVVSSGAQ